MYVGATPRGCPRVGTGAYPYTNAKIYEQNNGRGGPMCPPFLFLKQRVLSKVQRNNSRLTFADFLVILRFPNHVIIGRTRAVEAGCHV
jgi:hypothetical protein